MSIVELRITIQLGDTRYEVSETVARQIFTELKAIFDTPQNPLVWPWTTPPQVNEPYLPREPLIKWTSDRTGH
jgi:hypothetical protein